MKKIKIFRGFVLTDLEKEVNDWLDKSGARFDRTMRQTFTVIPGLNRGTEDQYIITILYMNTYGKNKSRNEI